MELWTGSPVTCMRSVPPAAIPGPLARTKGVPLSLFTSPTDENCGDAKDSAPSFCDATVTCSSGTGHFCSSVSDEGVNGIWKPTCPFVTPEANGPVTVMREPAPVACVVEPSSGDAPAAPCGRSMMSGPPMSTRVRALLTRSEEHTSELQSRLHLVCRLLL